MIAKNFNEKVEKNRHSKHRDRRTENCTEMGFETSS